MSPRVDIDLEGLIGRPITAYKDGKRREIGTIMAAKVAGERIEISATVTDEETRRAMKLTVRPSDFGLGRGIIQSA